MHGMGVGYAWDGCRMYQNVPGKHMGCSWDAGGMCMGLVQDADGVSRWDVHGMLLGWVWDVHRVGVGCKSDVYGMGAGCRWDGHGVDTALSPLSPTDPHPPRYLPSVQHPCGSRRQRVARGGGPWGVGRAERRELSLQAPLRCLLPSHLPLPSHPS